MRMSIANVENVISNAERRGVLLSETHTVARISDLQHIAASSRGKMELAMSEEPGEEDRLLMRLVAEAVRNVFDEWFKPKQFRSLVESFETGDAIHVGDGVPSSQVVAQFDVIKDFASKLPDLATGIEPDLPGDEFRVPLLAAVAEFILEALHCHNRLNKKSADGGSSYSV